MEASSDWVGRAGRKEGLRNSEQGVGSVTAGVGVPEGREEVRGRGQSVEIMEAVQALVLGL